MITRKLFDKISQKYGYVASWAVWADALFAMPLYMSPVFITEIIQWMIKGINRAKLCNFI
jgi:hypothetical protein